MDPILLRKQISDNTRDVQDFCADLKRWSREMSENESKNKPDNETVEQKSEAKTKNDQLITEKSEQSAIDKANFEKEKGNNFVKQQKWNEAIQCYTKAIECNSRNPIFYANRGLCYLKTEHWKEANSDTSTAIQLDSTYVKAYQRRAVAREKLNQLIEAQSDLKKVLQFEPKNKESSAELERIQKKIENTNKPSTSQSVFRQMQQQKRKCETDSDHSVKTQKNPEVDKENHFTKLKNDNNIEIVKPISKPPHLRSKKPLKRINITEESMAPQEIIKTTPKATLNTDELKIIENKAPETKSIVSEPSEINDTQTANTETLEINPALFVTPTNSVQFTSRWQALKKSNLKYEFLLQIEPKSIPKIFLDALDSRLFSEIISVLLENVKKDHGVLEYLTSFTNVRRFSTIAMFMSAGDKNGVRQLIEHAKSCENADNEMVNYLIAQYKL